MPTDSAQVTKAALALPLKKRASLAARLIRSVDSPSRAELEELWLKEAASRLKACQEGKMKVYPWSEVKAYARRIAKK